MMKKKLWMMLAAMTLTLTFAACGSSGGTAPAEETEDTAAEETAEATDEAEDTDTEETAEAETETEDEDEGVGGVFEADLETYKPVLDGHPEAAYFAFADLNKDYDAMVMTEVAMDDDEGGKVATEGIVFGLDADGNPVELGKVEGGADTPIAAANNFLYCGNKDAIYKMEIDDESGELVGVEAARIERDGEKETYFVGTSEEDMKEAADDSDFKRLLDEYNNATQLGFFEVEK